MKKEKRRGKKCLKPTQTVVMYFSTKYSTCRMNFSMTSSDKHCSSCYLKLWRTESTWEMRGNFLQEKSVNPKSWKPAGIEGLFWMKGFPMGSLGSCLWITALWRSKPRWVRKVIQQMSHLERKKTRNYLLTAVSLRTSILLALGRPLTSHPMTARTC